MFCLKKIRDDKNFVDQSFLEIYILNYLNKNGNPSKYNFLALSDFFYFNVSLLEAFTYNY